jgi:elongation factor 2
MGDEGLNRLNRSLAKAKRIRGVWAGALPLHIVGSYKRCADGAQTARAFCQFIMSPINQLMRGIMNDDKEEYEKMMVTLGITLKGDDKHLNGKPLMKRTIQIWINAADTLLSMIVSKLPSPRQAQKYRVENLYEGPMDDDAANVIRACDASSGWMR